MPIQSYQGGCHCGAVRYSADLDLDQGTIRCNCSLCSKSRAWFAFAPADKFKLVKSGEMVEYRWTPEGKPKPNLTYHICATCGVRTHATGTGPKGPTAAVQVATLENADPDLLAKGIRYVDGRNDDFAHEPDDTRLL